MAGILIVLAVYVLEFGVETIFWSLVVSALYRYEGVLRKILSVYIAKIALMGGPPFDLRETAFERGKILGLIIRSLWPQNTVDHTDIDRHRYG